jgi:gas vesicle protein
LSLPPDPDEPTRRLPPVQPAEPVREREVVTTEPGPGWEQEILDRLRSLRTGLALVGVLATAALGVGLWALLSQEEEGDAQQGASRERVQSLENQVDELESQTEDAASQSSVDRLRDQQQELEERLSAVEEQSSDDGGAEDVQADVRELSDAIEQNGQAIEQLDQRVGDLEQQQSQDSASP